MGGSNPYIKSPEVKKASRKFTIEYQPMGVKIEVDPENMPTAGTGLPGSVLDIALASDVDIDHACGGVVACATCHIVVKEGFETCSPATEDEEDMLDTAPGLTPRSRLSCQT